MENAENEIIQKKYEELLKIVGTLKKELYDSYHILKTSFNPLINLNLFERKRTILKEITEKIKKSGLFLAKRAAERTGYNYEDGISAEEAGRIEEIKALIKAEVFELSEINEAFSSLIRENIYYNQLTISFITDAFRRNSIYDRAGGNNTGFSPLKNVLMKSGVRV